MPSINPPGLIVILGATATGKTGTAIALAKRLNAPILSADSRQIYRGMDIGTAKPSMSDRQGIPHYLIDLASLAQTFTLAEYQQQAQVLIAEFHDRGVTPILVGGTGMYIKSIVHGMKIPRVAPDLGLRSQFQELGQSRCYQILQQVDPASTRVIHAHDQFRTMRALEVFYVTGVPLSQLQGEAPPTYPILQIGICTPEPDLHLQWIGDRLEQMLELGWLAEIQNLQIKYSKDNSLLRTLGYREMADFLSDRLSLEQAKDLIITHTRQFAKQQKTWFRGTGSQRFRIVWGDRDRLISDLLDLIHNRENWQVHTHNN
jgi:tRNA dimethylallyltransferase